MSTPEIRTAAEAAAAAVFDADRRIHTSVVGTGEHLQLIWARYEPGASYDLHTHPHEQFSVLLQGRLRLTVGDEVRDIGPGDMWYAPANVTHGGEILGDEAVIFIDVYGPPSERILRYVGQLRAAGGG
ncbi:MAG: cupin domain-containing protein [Gammaproteobacteria bacterium]|nr:cupin domain-containing protein [Gammaproteobacteria bacterium]